MEQLDILIKNKKVLYHILQVYIRGNFFTYQALEFYQQSLDSKDPVRAQELLHITYAYLGDNANGLEALELYKRIILVDEEINELLNIKTLIKK